MQYYRELLSELSVKGEKFYKQIELFILEYEFFYQLLVYTEKGGKTFSKTLLTLHQTSLHCISEGSNLSIHRH